ncbi:MAG: hypothetical protein R3300_08240 [Candidatus Promineifilaceae bacterium]|nr:hypothetical protein [Candidatus Promineifilaceae bacterium]
MTLIGRFDGVTTLVDLTGIAVITNQSEHQLEEIDVETQVSTDSPDPLQRLGR